MAGMDKRAAAMAIAAAVALAAPVAQRFEGYVPRARPDPVGVQTYCYGETANVDPARIYSRDECASKLRKRMGRDYAPKILACVPGFAAPERRQAFAAAIDASYNAGPKAFCASRMAESFNAGRWAQGCAGFRGWYVTARDRRTGQRVRLPGLVTRRDYESAFCARAAK